MLFAGMVSLVMTPPFLVPDEPAHFARAYQVAQGGFVGTRISATQSGAYLPATVAEIAKPFAPFFPDKGEKITGTMLAQAFDMPWSTLPTFVDIPNTVIYPPTSYMGGATGIFVAKRLNANPLATFYLARMGSLVINTSLGLLALWIAGDAGIFLLLLLTMPACVSLEASCSQDGFVLGLTALAVSILLQFAKKLRSIGITGLLSVCHWLWAVLRLPKSPAFLLSAFPFLSAPQKNGKNLSTF